VLDFLRGVSAQHTLLLVLEDLHDADRGTLDLLLYLARHLAGTPLLVVATYRDVDVDRAHPLAKALAELRRVSQVERIHLGQRPGKKFPRPCLTGQPTRPSRAAPAAARARHAIG
jgi:predicted ATPase